MLKLVWIIREVYVQLLAMSQDDVSNRSYHRNIYRGLYSVAHYTRLRETDLAEGWLGGYRTSSTLPIIRITLAEYSMAWSYKGDEVYSGIPRDDVKKG